MKTKIKVAIIVLMGMSFGIRAQDTNTFPLTGNVGIGTTYPQNKLHIIGPNNAGSSIYIESKNPNSGIRIKQIGQTGWTGNAFTLALQHGAWFGSSGPFNQGIYMEGNIGLRFFTGNSEKIRVLNNGNVGIGTSNPTSKFFIKQSTNDNTGGFTIQDANGRVIQLFGEGASGRQVIRTNTLNPLVFDLNGDEKVRFAANGNVGIGTASPTEKLTVKGKILCSEVEVVDISTIPDYVFQKYYTGTSSLKEDYQMPTLEEVEAYTKANHHLPEVPSAAEIKEEGLQLKEMTTILLQKIEELTLYTIEQEKRIKALEAQLAEQE